MATSTRYFPLFEAFERPRAAGVATGPNGSRQGCPCWRSAEILRAPIFVRQTTRSTCGTASNFPRRTLFMSFWMMNNHRTCRVVAGTGDLDGRLAGACSSWRQRLWSRASSRKKHGPAFFRHGTQDWFRSGRKNPYRNIRSGLSRIRTQIRSMHLVLLHQGSKQLPKDGIKTPRGAGPGPSTVSKRITVHQNGRFYSKRLLILKSFHPKAVHAVGTMTSSALAFAAIL